MNRILITNFLLIFALSFFLKTNVFSDNSKITQPDIRASNVILIERQSRLPLFEKNADELISPGGLTKIMTALLTFYFIERNEVILDEKFFISENSWNESAKGYNSMFVNFGDEVTVRNLLQGMITTNGNDAAIALAENIAGSEGEFVKMMNLKAKKLGLSNTNFVNATGKYNIKQFTTVRDIANLSAYMIENYELLYKMFSKKEFTWDRTGGQSITQSNRNPLLYKDIGADGIMTGYFQDEGYKLAASVLRLKDGSNFNVANLISVSSGFKDKEDREKESSKLFNWGYSNLDSFEYAIKKKISEDRQKITGNKSDDKKKGGSSGTAFFVSNNGHLLTNNHVVEGCKLSEITFKNKNYPANLLATDKTLDLALLKAEIKNNKFINFSKAGPKKLQKIYVAGYPLGKGLSDDLKISSGIVSSLKGFQDNSNEIQIDAAINPGNSGGPIINQNGELVAIAVAGLAKDVTEGINFGIKASAAEMFLKSNKLKPQVSNFLKDKTNDQLLKILEEATVYTYCD